MRMEREGLHQSVQLTNSKILFRTSIDMALLEFFNETAHRVGLPERMPRVKVSEIGGYFGVEIYSHSFEDAYKLWRLIDKYDGGAKLPEHTTN